MYFLRHGYPCSKSLLKYLQPIRSGKRFNIFLKRQASYFSMAFLLFDYVEEINDQEEEENELLPIPKQIRTRLDAMTYYSDTEFRDRFRMRKETVMLLLQEIVSEIPYINKNFCVNPCTQLLITLRYLSTGTFQRPVGDLFGVHRSTVSRVCYRICECIAKLRSRYIVFPVEAPDIQKLKLSST
jgi:hypothetical protein